MAKPDLARPAFGEHPRHFARPRSTENPGEPCRANRIPSISRIASFPSTFARAAGPPWSCSSPPAWRKSPYWHLSHEAGLLASDDLQPHLPSARLRAARRRAGAAAEHEALTKHVTLWNVAVERQIPLGDRMPKGSPTTSLRATPPASSRCTENTSSYATSGAASLNDPVLLRLSADEFWFSLADFRPAVLAPGRQRRHGDGGGDRRDRCLSAADPGAEVAGADGRPRGRRHPRNPLLRNHGSRHRGGVRWLFRSPASRARRATRSTCGTPPCMPNGCGMRC